MSLRRTWKRIRNVPGLGADVVAAILVIVVGVAAGGYIMSNLKVTWPFASEHTVVAAFAKAPAVKVSSNHDVRMAGVSVGRVTDARPLPDGTARVEMSIDSRYPIFRNARALLKTDTPINVMYVELNPGGPPAEPMPEGEMIPVSQTERLTQPVEVLNNLDERSRSALTSLVNQADAALVNAPQTLPGGLRATDTTLARFRPVIESLQTRRQTIRELITSLSRVSTAAGADDKRLADLAGSLQQTLGTLANRDNELGNTLGQLPGFSTDLQQAMKGVNNLVGQLNPTLDDLHRASEALPPALQKLQGTLEEALPVVQKARPVVQKAGPVVGDLRPFVNDLDTALDDLKPTTGHLPCATKKLAPWMPNLAAFVYHTSSAFSVYEPDNNALGRADLNVDVSNPTGGLTPQPNVDDPPGYTGLGDPPPGYTFPDVCKQKGSHP